MQDPRLRLLAVLVLSISAFMGIEGAFLAFVWWIGCSGGPDLIRRSPRPLIAFLPLILVTMALFATGSEWFSYLVRLGVVILIAIYAYQDQKPGEFIQVCGWAFGSRAGFDIGLAGEMVFGSIRFLEEEIRRIRQAYQLKGNRLGVRNLVAVSSCLVFGLLRRAEDQADLLLARGYFRGGTSCARFVPGASDVFSAGIAVIFSILGFMPVGEFFILGH